MNLLYMQIRVKNHIFKIQNFKIKLSITNFFIIIFLRKYKKNSQNWN